MLNAADFIGHWPQKKKTVTNWQRIAAHLLTVEPQTAKQIAAATGIPENTVRSALHSVPGMIAEKIPNTSEKKYTTRAARAAKVVA